LVRERHAAASIRATTPDVKEASSSRKFTLGPPEKSPATLE